MSGISTFSLPATAAPKLEAMVDQIIARPGQLIDLKAMEQVPEQLDVKAVIKALPEAITEDDFVKMLRLAMLTESGTDSYAAVFQEGADKYNATWLTRFNKQVWVPDEYTHTLPYYMMLAPSVSPRRSLIARSRNSRSVCTTTAAVSHRSS